MKGIQRRIGPGRPRGQVSREILVVLRRNGPMTARELALYLQLTVNVAEFTCSRLASSGDVEVVDRVNRAWSNRRVSLYGVAPKATGCLPTSFIFDEVPAEAGA